MKKYKYLIFALSLIFVVNCGSSEEVSVELQDIDFQATVDAGIAARLAEVATSEPTPTPTATLTPQSTLDVQAMIDAAVAKALESVPKVVETQGPTKATAPTPTPTPSWAWNTDKDSLIVGKSAVLVGQFPNSTEASNFSSLIDKSDKWPLITTEGTSSSRQNQETFKTGWLLSEYPNHIVTTAKGFTSSPFVDLYFSGWQQESGFKGWIVGRDEEIDLAIIKIIDSNSLPTNIVENIYDSSKPIIPSKNITDSKVSEIFQGLGFCLYCEGNNSGWTMMDSEILVNRYKRDSSSGIRYSELILMNDETIEGIEEGLGIFDSNYSLVGITMSKDALKSKGINVSSEEEVVYMIETSTIDKHLPDLYNGKINTDFTIPPNLNSAAVPPLPAFIQGTIKKDNVFVELGKKYFVRVVAPKDNLVDIWLNFDVGLNGSYNVTLGLNDSQYIGATVEFYFEGQKTSADTKFKGDMSITQMNLNF